jgi:hypothetical protein
VTVMTAGRRINWGWSTDWPQRSQPRHRNNGDSVRKYLPGVERRGLNG